MLRGYYFITDRNLSRAGTENDVRQAVQAGVKTVQYRDKNISTREMCAQAAVLRRICKDILFLVNDRVDVAVAAGADGVHLGQDDMPCSQARRILGRDACIGVTVHDLHQAEEACRAGADYLGVSPIFKTTTKADAGTPAGVSLLNAVREVTSLPLVAIGGITPANAREVIEAGADALCALSAVLSADDIRIEIERFQRFFKNE